MITRRSILKTLMPLSLLYGCGGIDDRSLIDVLTSDDRVNILIDSIVIVDFEVVVRSKTITIMPGGCFKILNGSLSIENSTVDIYFPDGSNLFPNSAFRVVSGKFEATNTKFTAFSADKLIDGEYFDDPAPNLIINGINEIDDFDLYREINLFSNEFVSQVKRFVAVLSVSNHLESDESFDARRFCKFRASNNSFIGFHGVVGVGGLISADVVGNYLSRNTFIQFVFRGDNIKFHNNRVHYPGNGQTGDGLNVIGSIRNCSIVSNDIFYGRCYGMAIYSEKIENLTIRDNFIYKDITHAIILKSKSLSNAWLNVDILNNIIVDNIGGVAISGLDCSGVKINGNYFQNSLKNWPSPVLSFNSSIDYFVDNLIFDHIAETLSREVLTGLTSLGSPCPPIYVTGIR
jgi:hypothetical protein